MSVIEVLYLLSAALLAVYGYNALVLTWLRLARHQPVPVKAFSDEDEPPYVTVQLPVYNERYVVARLIAAVGALRYPRHRLQVQVLDDSTDITTAIIARAVEQQRAQGLDIAHIRRPGRLGYKGGALAYGLRTAKGEFIAIFDADFLPQPDFLERIMPYYRGEPRIGCLQGRWGHINREASWLTRAQASGIDGHFTIEQQVRSQHGLFLNFNGTAGVWRKSCIEEAGGWQHDTLTEDLDLSYRAQLKGWRIQYIPHVVVPAELPVHINAFKRQQFRWAKGSIQTARKLLPAVWRSQAPVLKKIEATIHLTNYAVHPLMLLNLAIALPLISTGSPYVWVLPVFLISTIGPLWMYWSAMRLDGQHLTARIHHLAMLLFMGMGLSLNNSIAVFEALLGVQSAFLRTPKFNIRGEDTPVRISDYLLPRDPTTWLEMTLAVYAAGLLVYVLAQGVWSLVFWLFLYAGGYFYIAGLNLRQSLK